MEQSDIAADLDALRSRLWNILTPGEAAAWICERPATAYPVHPLPAGSVATLRRDPGPEWRDALELAGLWARLTIPAAAQTAGEHWLLTIPGSKRANLRLTVGVLEVLVWRRMDDLVLLRLDADVIDDAVDCGELDTAAWEELERLLVNDSMATLAEERYNVECSDIATAIRIMGHPVVTAAARRLNTRLAAGGCPSRRHHQPDLASQAWQLAEPRLASWPGAAHEPLIPSPRTDGTAVIKSWDRPYSDLTVEVSRPAPVTADPDSGEAGRAEHNRLCRLLHDRLAAAGMGSGQHLHGVPVDLAWRDSRDRQFIAEIKSRLAADAGDQFRLGLGQVLEYRHRLRRAGHAVQAVLVLTRVEERWTDLCADLDVVLLSAEESENWVDQLRRLRINR